MGFGRGIFTGLGLLALTACATAPVPPPEAVATSARPPVKIVMPPPPPTIISPPSSTSTDLVKLYARLEREFLTRGLMRTDGGGPDTPFTDTQLARNFVRIALFDEYVSEGDLLRARATATELSRWDRPVRVTVEFGKSVPMDQRPKDTVAVAQYVDRLARITGHSITMSDTNPNFHVMFWNEDDRLGSAARLNTLLPDIAPSSMRAILGLPAEQLCVVVGVFDAGKSTYSKAVAVIRGEHPDLLRKSCIHEEIAQGLGLPNDSPAARPSIFNDDEEFALLTTHDEFLLKILYDPRLRPGMDAAEAAPIIRQIATELTGGSAS